MKWTCWNCDAQQSSWPWRSGAQSGFALADLVVACVLLIGVALPILVELHGQLRRTTRSWEQEEGWLRLARAGERLSWSLDAFGNRVVELAEPALAVSRGESSTVEVVIAGEGPGTVESWTLTWMSGAELDWIELTLVRGGRLTRVRRPVVKLAGL